MRELEVLPVGMLEDILLLRAYAGVKAQLDSGVDEQKVSGNRLLVQWCGDIVAEIKTAELRDRVQRNGAL